MSLLDCVNQLLDAKSITDKQGVTILQKAERLENMYRATGKVSEADLANKASRDSLNNMLEDISFAQYQESLTVQRLMDRRASINKNAAAKNNWGGIRAKTRGHDLALGQELLRTENRGQAINGQAVAQMYDFVEAARSKVGGNIDKLFAKNNQLTRQVVRILHGDEGSAEARVFADMYQTASDFIFNGKQRAGINIHKLENFGVGHRWNASLLKGKGKQAFVRDAFERVDRNRMVSPDGNPLDDANLTVVLENIYNKLTGGVTRDLPMDGEFLSSGATKSIRSTEESSRILHFKTGDDWLQMHDTYGSGDIFENMLGDINRGAHDIALFEMFGPNPKKVFDSLIQENKIHNQLARDRGERVRTRKLVGTPQQMWNLLTGSVDSINNPLFAETLATFRNLQASSKLHSAVLSNITDQAFAFQQLRRWGGSYTNFVGKWIGQLKPGNVADRKLAAEMGLGLEWAYNAVSSANRFGDIDAIGRASGISKRMADFTIRTSGLSSLNRASRSAAGLEINATVARNAQSDWANLDSRVKLGLQEREITSSDWDVIRSTLINHESGATYINMPALLNKNQEISTKLSAIFHEVVRKAAPEPDLEARAIVTGGGAGRGSIAREAAQTLLQFKTFPITVLIQTMRDQMFDPRLAATSTRIGDAAKLGIMATALGGGIVQLKNIVAGKDFEDPATLSFALKSVAQGGSLGVINDAISLGSQSDRGRIAEQLLGPTMGLWLDILTGLNGAGSALFDPDFDKISKNVINTVLNNTPGKTFYTKLAVERLIFDQLEEIARPSAYKDWNKYRKSQAKRTGQGFWWSQGDALPSRLPEIAEQPEG